MQQDALRDYVTRHGWEAAEFVDQGVSGARAKRPALNAMLDAVHRRAVDAVVVTKLDRVMCQNSADAKRSRNREVDPSSIALAHADYGTRQPS